MFLVFLFKVSVSMACRFLTKEECFMLCFVRGKMGRR
uniref:Uncharacterized protein n=1 Tax=Rhizophora mucronata TaxID=61149 RepID=A0A2P2QP26_RHIMU